VPEDDGGIREEKRRSRFGKYSVSFQSRLAGEPWLEPFTDFEFVRLAKAGTKSLLVMCPSFVADCLETLEEISMTGAKRSYPLVGNNLRRFRVQMTIRHLSIFSQTECETG
jgi:protoheme ferro-lyase